MKTSPRPRIVIESHGWDARLAQRRRTRKARGVEKGRDGDRIIHQPGGRLMRTLHDPARRVCTTVGRPCPWMYGDSTDEHACIHLDMDGAA